MIIASMVVKLDPPSQRGFQRALEALFREARILERRRRRRYAMLALLASAVLAAAGHLIVRGGGDPNRTSGQRPAPVAVSSIRLPARGDYFSLAVVGGHLIVSGGPQGSLFPSGSTTSTSGGRPSGTCDAATVDPVTLRLTDVARANCGDPQLYGERVLPVNSALRGLAPGGGTLTMGVRIARVDPAAPGGYTIGPIVMSYPQCSDCGVEWIYGDGSLWVYDALVGGGANPPGELLRVSESTGTVQQRWVMPSITTALLAVDADGLWVAPSIRSGSPLHTPPSQLIRYQSLYRVSPGERAPTRVFALGSGGALWLIASRHSVWVDARAATKFVLSRLEGKDPAPTLHAPYPANTSPGIEYGTNGPNIAGNAKIGIYYVVNGNGTQRIVRLSPDAATERNVATVRAPTTVSSYGMPPSAAALTRAFFFLDPPTISYPGGNSKPVLQGAGVLYRVTPQAPS
jgi:hypothetical protein